MTRVQEGRGGGGQQQQQKVEQQHTPPRSRQDGCQTHDAAFIPSPGSNIGTYEQFGFCSLKGREARIACGHDHSEMLQ
jgi:hypothetical protein